MSSESGPWECVFCSEPNKAHRSSCNNCEQPRSASLVLKAFQHWDQNGDGVITKDELSTVLDVLGGASFHAESADAIFRAIDKNSDGRLQARELISWIFSCELSGRQEFLSLAIANCSKNGPSSTSFKWECSTCGEYNRSSRASCNNCGERRQMDEESVSHWICQFCEEPNKSGRDYCQNCNNQYEPPHRNGIVLWIDSLGATHEDLQNAVQNVSHERHVLVVDSVESAKKRIWSIPEGVIVCIVCSTLSQEAVAEMSVHLRGGGTVSDRGLSESMPLVWFTSDSSVERKAAAMGCVVETDISRLSSRVLSLPPWGVLRGELKCASFKGSLVDLQFGHYANEAGKDFNFIENKQHLQQCTGPSQLSWYAEASSYDTHIKEVEAYTRSLSPVHRCKPGTFLAILREGGLMSRDAIQELLNCSSPLKAAILRVTRNVRLQTFLRQSRFSHLRYKLLRYIDAVCHLHFSDEGDVASLAQRVSRLRPGDVSSTDLAALESVLESVIQDFKMLNESKGVGGIGYPKDALLGTTRHVFATLGPNPGFYYGSVVLVLNPHLLYHPDTWCTPLAATGFVGPNYWAFTHRPWSGRAAPHGTEDYHYTEGVAKDLHPCETPEDDTHGVEACVKSSMNMAAMRDWSKLMAREIDAMCHYLVFDHRCPRPFDKDYGEPEKRMEAKQQLLAEDLSFKTDAWRTVVEWYETKDSHTMYECHLPGFIPVDAIDRVIISSDLYTKHTDIQNKVMAYTLSDGRRLRDLTVLTSSPEECMAVQHDYFNKRRLHASDFNAEPISLSLSERSWRPAFLPSDFPAWVAVDSESWRSNEDEMVISCACRANDNIHVYFSQNAEAQREDSDLGDEKWDSMMYHFALGIESNSTSFIGKGVQRQSALMTVQDDPTVRCLSCGKGESSCSVWERYWFQYKCVGRIAFLTCGRGPKEQNVMMSAEDHNAIRNLKYIGLSCGHSRIVYCDLLLT